ncbi:glycosyltransferase family 2 protein [Vibrio splendidus]|uniref:glycosyltransferase family 2 protein n=1 Tax=Vibrio splendidus TaxID=29497 RepID=UPI00352FC902
MSDNVMFSVIIPVYNRSETIARSIDSILNQSIVNFEIIVVDDHSSDIEDLERILERYNDIRIKLIKHSSNRFGGAARNTGIKCARGKWIAFLDSDDIWFSNKLEVAYDFLSKSDPNTVFYSRLVKGFIDEKNGSVLPKNGIGKLKVSDYIFLNNGLIQTSSICLSKELASVTMFNESLIRHQDYDFCLRLEENGASFKFYDKPLLHWVQDGSSVQSKGATSVFCSNWIENYKQYFSERSYIGYKVKVLIPILVSEKKIDSALSIIKKSSTTNAYLFFMSICILFKGLVKLLLVKFKK